MEPVQKKDVFLKRDNKKQVFDKRLVKKIVKDVESGVPRRDVINKYGMTKGTLSEWMNKYGSPAYHSSKRQVYSSSKKRTILRAIETGMSLREAQVSFGVKHVAMVRKWVRDAKQENYDLSTCNSISMAKPSEKKESDEVKALKQALAEAQLKIQALDTMIDIAEEQLKINIRKKSDARQSSK